MTQERAQVVEAVRESLMRRASPRAHMLVLVSLTAVAGFVASYLLLQAGLSTMALRYPLAVGVGYVVFLGLVRLWLRRFRLRARGRDAGVDLDVIDLPIGDLFAPEAEPEPQLVGRNSSSDGEGGDASWGDDPASFTSSDVASESPGGSGGGSSGGGWGLDLDDDALWLVPVALILAIAFGVIAYTVMLAPTLFAELLLNVGLAAGLYRKLVRMERRSWLATAIRSTIVPACFAAALLGAAGAFMQSLAPDAVSIGGVVNHLQWKRTQNLP
jgi:hypothetical protein